MLLRVTALLLCLAGLSNGAQLSTHAFGNRVVKGQATTHNLNYITGMVASRIHKDIVWMVTSDDQDPYLFAVDVNTGNEVAWFNVSASSYDWEDLAYGPCVDNCGNNACGVGKPVSEYCIYIADIGNHGGDGAHDTIYMVREPTSLGGQQPGVVYQGNVSVVDQLTFSWSEEDAETLMIAPDSRLFVISKIDTGRAMIVQIPDNGWGGNTVVLNEAATGVLKVFTSHHDPQSGSISPGGDEMIVVGEDDVWYYSVNDGDYINAVRTQIPQRVANYVAQKDTEAITWDPEAKGFYTFARANDQFIYYYPRDPNAGVVG